MHEYRFFIFWQLDILLKILNIKIKTIYVANKPKHELLGSERYIGMRSSVEKKNIWRLNMVIGKIRQRLENAIGLEIFSTIGAYEKKDFFAGRLKCFNLLLPMKTLYLFLNGSNSNDCSLCLKTRKRFFGSGSLGFRTLKYRVTCKYNTKHKYINSRLITINERELYTVFISDFSRKKVINR